jgi:hypothetical protein
LLFLTLEAIGESSLVPIKKQIFDPNLPERVSGRLSRISLKNAKRLGAKMRDFTPILGTYPKMVRYLYMKSNDF